jgi:hypothetical protein
VHSSQINIETFMPIIPKLAGQQSRCIACGLLFTSTNSFDQHRTGSYTTGRRCKTTDELRAIGFEPNARGLWRKTLTIEQRAKLFALRPSTITTENNHHATR